MPPNPLHTSTCTNNHTITQNSDADTTNNPANHINTAIQTTLSSAEPSRHGSGHKSKNSSNSSSIITTAKSSKKKMPSLKKTASRTRSSVDDGGHYLSPSAAAILTDFDDGHHDDDHDRGHACEQMGNFQICQNNNNTPNERLNNAQQQSPQSQPEIQTGEGHPTTTTSMLEENQTMSTRPQSPTYATSMLSSDGCDDDDDRFDKFSLDSRNNSNHDDNHDNSQNNLSPNKKKNHGPQHEQHTFREFNNNHGNSDNNYARGQLLKDFNQDSDDPEINRRKRSDTMNEISSNTVDNNNSRNTGNSKQQWWRLHRRASLQHTPQFRPQLSHSNPLHGDAKDDDKRSTFAEERKKLGKSDNDFPADSGIRDDDEDDDDNNDDDNDNDNGGGVKHVGENNNTNMQWWQFGRGNRDINSSNNNFSDRPKQRVINGTQEDDNNGNHKENDRWLFQRRGDLLQGGNSTNTNTNGGGGIGISARWGGGNNPRDNTNPLRNSQKSATSYNRRASIGSSQPSSRRGSMNSSSTTTNGSARMNRRASLTSSNARMNRRASLTSSGKSNLSHSSHSLFAGLGMGNVEGEEDDDDLRLPPDPKSSEDVEVIVENMRKNFITVNPLERALLEDMANTDEDRLKSRWSGGERKLTVSKAVGVGGLTVFDSVGELEVVGGEDSSREVDYDDERDANENVSDFGTADEDDAESQDKHSGPQAQYASKYTNPDKNKSGADPSSVWDELEDVSDKPCSRWKNREEERRRNSLDDLPDKSPTSASQTINSTDYELSPLSGSENESRQLLCDWGSSDLCKLKDNVRLSKVQVLDDVSSIASSEHSGRIATAKKPKQWRRRSLGLSFGWNKPSMSNNTRDFGEGTTIDGDFDDKEDDDLEDEIFAERDAKYETVIKDANEIMSKVNKSVIAMGNEAPFRPVEEIIPPFKKLSKNLLLQMDGLGTNLRSVRMSKSRRQKRDGKRSRNSSLAQSIVSMTSYASEGSSFFDPTNNKAMDEFIAKQSGASPSTSAAQSSADKSHVNAAIHYTAYLPNFMWYQFSAGDPSSRIRPTSLCSGTGITGGHQYLDREMLDVFNMFGSYFVGAFGSFQEEGDEEGNANNPKSGSRRAFWMDSIDEEDSMMSDTKSSDHDGSEISTSDLSVDYLSTNADAQVVDDPEAKIVMLQKVIEDLRRSQLK